MDWINTEKLLGIGHIGQAFFTIWSRHFQTVTICHGFIAFGLQPLFEFAPIRCGINAVRQYANHIDNGKIPFFLFFIPRRADALIFKKFDFIIHLYCMCSPCSCIALILL